MDRIHLVDLQSPLLKMQVQMLCHTVVLGFYQITSHSAASGRFMGSELGCTYSYCKLLLRAERLPGSALEHVLAKAVLSDSPPSDKCCYVTTEMDESLDNSPIIDSHADLNERVAI